MSQAAAQQPSRKKTVISLLVLLALTCIIVFTFKDHWAEITTALAQLSVWQVLAVLAVGISYPLLEGCVAWVIVRSRLPQFTLRQGLDVGWCGTFGNVVTLGAGAVPVQLYYLHRAGLPLGPGAGLMTLEYVFHKSTVLLYATVMLLLQRRWLAANTTGVMRYLPMAYAVVAVIIVALVLLCVSPLVQNLARWLLGFLPKTEKWQQRRADWLEQLEVLSTESRRLLADKPRCLKIFALQALKLFGLFCLPYLCIRFMGPFAAGLLAGAAAHQPDALRLQRPAQRSRDGLYRDRLSAGVRQLSGTGRGDERADALPHRQLLCSICRQRRGLFHRPAASGANGAAKGGVSR